MEKKLASEKYERMKEIKSRYSTIAKAKTLNSKRDVIKSAKTTARGKVNKTFVIQNTDAETQTQFSVSKDGVDLDEIKQDLSSEYEVKESLQNLEVRMLKAKLQEQINANITAKKIISLENKSLGLLIKKVDSHIQSQQNMVDYEKNSLDGDTLSDTPLSKKFSLATNVENIKNSEINQDSKQMHSNCVSESGAIDISHPEAVSKEFDNQYTQLTEKIDILIKMNKSLINELNVKKSESSEEKKIEDDKSTTKGYSVDEMIYPDKSPSNDENPDNNSKIKFSNPPSPLNINYNQDQSGEFESVVNW